SALALGDLLLQLRRDLEQVTDHTEAGDLEDRGLRVLVHRDDRLARLHAGALLARTREAQRRLELRRHALPGVPDLELGWVVTGVDGRTGRGDRGTQRVGQRLDHRELLGVPDTTTTGDHDGRLGQLRTVTADQRLPAGDLGRLGRVDRGQL